MTGWIIAIIVLVVMVGIFVGLYFFGKKMQTKQEAQQEQMMAAAQPASLLVIDKKRMKVKDANLPKVVMDQVPKRLRGSKMPIVKAKVGPQVLSLICDEAIFDEVPVKREVKAMISGIYIVSVKNIRGTMAQPEGKKKKSWRSKLLKKQQELRKEIEEENTSKKKNKK
ncbi:MAG: hypothetical protein SOT70_04185 [Lachnospiraceae bacterium]|nr:hypothetical protein [Lachnospiraceae bacterium]